MLPNRSLLVIHFKYSSVSVSIPSGSVVKNLSAMQESWVQSMGQEDSLEKGMATHSSVLVWKIPWTEELGRPLSMGSQKSRTRLSE